MQQQFKNHSSLYPEVVDYETAYVLNTMFHNNTTFSFISYYHTSIFTKHRKEKITSFILDVNIQSKVFS